MPMIVSCGDEAFIQRDKTATFLRNGSWIQIEFNLNGVHLHFSILYKELDELLKLKEHLDKFEGLISFYEPATPNTMMLKHQKEIAYLQKEIRGE